MSIGHFKSLVTQQKQFFSTHTTFPFEFRKKQLLTLKKILTDQQNQIAEAIMHDLQKPYSEAVFIEVMLVIDEIKYIISNLESWMRPQKTKSPFPLLWPGTSKIFFEPYGSVLIIAPWNFPFFLTFSPLIGALCAGNCAILKPSEHAPYTQELIAKLIRNNFSPEYIAVVTGGPEEVQNLLQEKMDYIFFTGGTNIGKEIMLAAAKQLTPVTLELGGKSPCIVDETADLELAAKKIIWAKMNNAGQVCIAPDYVYVHQNVKHKLIKNFLQVLKKFYSDTPEKSPDFGRIINEKHFLRLTALLQDQHIIVGGERDQSKRYIAPTIIDNVNWQTPVMQEEIFGPILPVMSFNSMNEVIEKINQHPIPLALYLFSNDTKTQKQCITDIKFGGACINNCMVHIANVHLPFGGVGSSGMGMYHGRYSFETFSHRKSVYKKNSFFDFGLEYPPYTQKKLNWLKRLLRV